ncbi:alpha/beta hydrolase family protein [Deinococcus yavapaiensis]|uniref:Serine aminopeptidase S33 family n=1 Tax=Deinococcus yavapaiensis KR-236 TaxID=694435 RepID=A0A318S9Y5_9DEIO|nr:alpha/beta fold hydrolase [Deinococcus yavapaiensis]PYE53044.1 serine aminopeptidase S33 family [Deinococcus yavapaiensis KR-236]
MRVVLALNALLGVNAASRYASIEQLRADTFGSGAFTVTRVLERNAAFTRSEVRWDSDNLKVAGFMNVPSGKGPFPVVLVLHGYVDPSTYRLLDYTTRYADALARAGFLVIHPNYRGHGASQGRPDGAFRIEYARDVLNLASIVRKSAGQAGPLREASANVGLWGHSMGGGIAQRVAVVDPKIKAVVLYGAMSGDDRKNARQVFYVFSKGTRGREELDAPRSVTDAVSPAHFYRLSNAVFSVHQGAADDQVPAGWARETCAKLKAAGKSAECFEYARAPHTFRGAADATFQARVTAFFRRNLR